MPILLEIINFFKKPTVLEEIKSTGRKDYLIKMIVITAIVYSTSILIGGITMGIAGLFGYNANGNHAFNEILYNGSIQLWQLLLIVILIGPFLEEVAFRSMLTGSRSTVFISLFFFWFYISGIILGFFDDVSAEISLATLVVPGLFLVGLYFILPKDSDIVKAINKNYSIFIYGTSIIFGLIHLGNFQNSDKFWWLLPILVLPQVTAGMIFAYARLRYGLLAAIITHGGHNLLIISPVIILAVVLPDDALRNLFQGRFESLEVYNSELGLGIILFLIIFTIVFYISINQIFKVRAYLSKKKLETAE